jgi:hypothetical protein
MGSSSQLNSFLYGGGCLLVVAGLYTDMRLNYAAAAAGFTIVLYCAVRRCLSKETFQSSAATACAYLMGPLLLFVGAGALDGISSFIRGIGASSIGLVTVLSWLADSPSFSERGKGVEVIL